VVKIQKNQRWSLDGARESSRLEIESMFFRKSQVSRYAMVVAVGAAMLGFAAASQAYDYEWTGDKSLPSDSFSSGNKDTVYTIHGNSGTLTVGSFTMGGLARVVKTGDGTLSIGTMNCIGSCSLDIVEGTLLLTGQNSVVSFHSERNVIPGVLDPVYVMSSIIVRSGGTLGGSGKVDTLWGGNLHIEGTFAPGNGTNETGTFTYNGRDGFNSYSLTFTPAINFTSSSTFELDVRAENDHDILNFNIYASRLHGDAQLNIFDGAKVKLNFLDDFADGTYTFSFITFTKDSGVDVDFAIGFRESLVSWGMSTGAMDRVFVDSSLNLSPGDNGTFITNGSATAAGFQIANPNADYEYQFVYGPSGVDLIVTVRNTDVPEPASLGVLGVGVGMLMIRRKR